MSQLLTVILLIISRIIQGPLILYEKNGMVYLKETRKKSSFILPSLKKKIGLAKPLSPKFSKKLLISENTKYSRLINKASIKYGISAFLIKAIIKVESNFDNTTVSRANALGLMQLMTETARLMGVKNILNPEENIMGGTKYLKFLLNKYKENLFLALAAYNAGPTTVDKFKGIPPYKETRRYIQKVKWYYEYYMKNCKEFQKEKELVLKACKYFNEKEYKKALESFKKATSVAPHDANNYYNIGVIYDILGDTFNSYKFYLKAIELNSYIKEAYYNLAVLCEKRADYIEAIKWWKKFLNSGVTEKEKKEAENFINELGFVKARRRK